MNTLYYLAYGSNLHPDRLVQRTPSASVVGTVELADTAIVFHKRSIDGSGKCMILKDEINRPVAFGALFAIEPKEQGMLDKAESVGKGYNKRLVKCPVGETEYTAFTYVADPSAIDASLKPYHWYKQLVIAGARYHQFPERYISYLKDPESIQDPDNERRLSNERILESLRMYPKSSSGRSR